MALSHHPRDGRTSVKTIGEGACNWPCRPHFTDGKERAGNHTQMCLPTVCAMADGVGFVCAVCVLCDVVCCVVWCGVHACARVCMCVYLYPSNVLMGTWSYICHHYSEYYTLLVVHKDF